MKLRVSAVSAACIALLSLPQAALPQAAPADRSAASYQFALGKLLAVEGAVADALAAFEKAEALAPDSPETIYVLLEHGQLLARMAQYARNPSLRDENLRQAGEKVAQARKLAPENLDVLRAVGEIHLDLSVIDPSALTVARDALEIVRQRDKGDAQSFLTLGRIYLDQDQPAKAAEVFQELVTNLPQQRTAYALLVESLMRAEKPEEAEKALREILSFDPGSLEARLTLADLQSRRGDSKAVLETLRGAPEEVKDDPRLRRQLAWALYQSGELDEALKAVEVMGGKDPESQALVLLKGLVLAAKGENDEAIRLLVRARENQPKDAALGLSTARVMQRAGRRDEAVRLLTGLADTLLKDGKAPEANELRLEAAEMQLGAKEWDKAGDTLKPLLSRPEEPVRLRAALLQADALAGAGRYDQALAALAKEQGSDAVVSRRAEILARAGREEEAGRLIASLTGGDSASALSAAQTYQRLDRHQEAIPILEKITTADPEQPVAAFLLGSAYEETGQRDKAIAELKRVVRLAPEFHPALNFLGYTYAEMGTNLEEALDLVQRAVALEPDNGAYVDSLGWIYYRMGRPEQARGYLERATRLEPEDATLHEHLGDVYVALGQTERARQAYERALELGAEPKERDQVQRKIDGLGKKTAAP